MRFVVSRDLKDSPLIRKLLVLFLASLILFLGLQPWVELKNFGLSPTQILNHIAGNPDLFQPPMKWTTLLELVHVDLFFRLIAALSLLSLATRMISNQALLAFFIVVLNVAIVFNAIGPLGVYAGIHWATWVKSISYVIQQLIFISLSFYGLIYLLRPSDKGKTVAQK